MPAPTAAAVHYYSSKGNKISAGITAPFSDSGEQPGTAAGWYVRNLTKAEAEGLTTAKVIEELVWLVEKYIAAGSAQLLDVYLSLVINGETFNLFVKEVTLNEWTIIGGGTALEAIGKTTLEPTVPSSSKELSCEGLKKVQGKFTVTEAVKNALERTIVIGRSTEGTAGEGITAGEQVAIQFEAEKTLPIKYIEAHSNTVAPTCTSLVLGIYADNAGVPGELLGEATCSGAAIVTNGWCTATLGSTIPLVKGTKYWLSYLPVGGTFSVLLTTGTGVEYTLGEAGTTLKPFSGTWTKHEFTQALRASGVENEGVAIPLNAASASASASLELGALTRIPAQPASASSSATAELAAPTALSPGAAQAVGSASLAFGRPSAVPVEAASSASSASATLAVTSAAAVPLDPAVAASSATLNLKAPTLIASQPASASGSASLGLAAATAVIPQAASAASAASLGLGTLTAVTVQAATAASVASAVIAAATSVALQPAAAVSATALVLEVSANGTLVPVQAAIAASSGALALAAPVVLSPQAAQALSSGSLVLLVTVEWKAVEMRLVNRPAVRMGLASRAAVEMKLANRRALEMELG